MDAKENFKSNLERLLAVSGLRDTEFVDQYVRTSGTKLRPRAVQEWLTGERVAYKTNLVQLTAFWRAWVPNLDSTHLFLPPDEFAKVVAPRSKDLLGNVVLDLSPAQISEEQITSVCGSYRIFRYDYREARIVSEALAIRRRLEGNKAVLDASLWSPTTRTPQEFQGAVIVLGNSVYMVLYDSDPASSMMRFLNLPMLQGKLDTTEFGMVSGTFDANGTNAAMGLAIEKKSIDPNAARDAVKKPAPGNDAWVLANATAAVNPAVLVALQRPIQPKVG